MARVMGIDPGSTLLGWCLYDTDGGVLRDFGHHAFRAKDRIQRLGEVRQYIHEILPGGCDVDLVAQERMFSTKSSADFCLHVVSYFIQERCQELGVLWLEVATTTAKKAATGNGAAKKDEVLLVLQAAFGVELTEDESDAIAVALAGAAEVAV